MGSDGEFDYGAMINALEKLPPKTVVILQPAAHNPSGRDPTKVY